MKISGIILLVLGILSTLGAIIGAINGHSISFSGLAFVVLGAFLLSRANKNKEEEEKKRKWAEGNSNETE
jgi:uncharacterized membrane protein YbaN (DUF454 family)